MVSGSAPIHSQAGSRLISGRAVTGNDRILYQLKLDETVTISRIRVDFPEKICDGWARIVEVEAWGFED